MTTLEAEASHTPLSIRGHGTVSYAKATALRPQVSGRIEWLHPNLVPGGELEAGELVVKIEADDYEISLAEANAGLEQAKAQLEIERGREAVAEREWEIFEETAANALGEERGEFKSLATREPQIRAALSTISAAKQRVRRARLSLRRTSLTVPSTRSSKARTSSAAISSHNKAPSPSSSGATPSGLRSLSL